MLMSGLAGVAAALAVAIMLTVYFRTGYRSLRDIVRHGLAAALVLGLLAFVAYDMRHAALAYLGINPAKPAVEFEIRLPKARCGDDPGRTGTDGTRRSPAGTACRRRSRWSVTGVPHHRPRRVRVPGQPSRSALRLRGMLSEHP